MRIAWTSDLHVDLSERNHDLLPHLAARAAALDADAFVVAGDVAETLDAVEAALEAFADLDMPRFYVPGNHDLFVETTADGAFLDSRAKLERLLPARVQNAGFHYLGLDPVSVPPWTFVGTCGWFDASLADPGLAPYLAPGHFATGVWRGMRAFDHGHVLWPSARPAPGMPCSLGGSWSSDAALCDTLLDHLQQQLRQVSDDSNIIAVIHVLPFPELVQRHAFGPSGLYDAWLGSARLGECLRQDPRVRLVITGHLHRVAQLTIRPGLRAVAHPVGDARKSPLPLPELARERLGVLDLDADAPGKALPDTAARRTLGGSAPASRRGPRNPEG